MFAAAVRSSNAARFGNALVKSVCDLPYHHGFPHGFQLMAEYSNVFRIAALALAVAGVYVSNSASAQWRRAPYDLYYYEPDPAVPARPQITPRQQAAARLAWQSLPPAETSCLGKLLQQRGFSVRALISRGVTPADRRLLQLRSSCRIQITQNPQRTAVQPSASAQITAAASSYVVDGVALGSTVPVESEAHKLYQCAASDRFPGFAQCRKEERKTEGQNETVSSHSMLRTQDGTAWYIKSYIAPASIKKSDVQNELAKLSAKFGENPRTFEMPQREGLPNAIIAVWGKIQLEPLDSNDVSVVASGGPHKGLLVSFLGDLQKSAKAEVPIYRLAGGAGYLWAATFDEDGRGVLQSLAIDASQIGSPAAVATNDDRAVQSRVRTETDTPILVSLESEGGTYKVPVLVNKAITLKFVVDSGASDVSIPADVVGTLLQTGTLQQSDFVGVQIYKLADGSTLPSARFRIRSLTVGDTVVENVTAGITPVEGSLLLGQSFLSRFKSWSMDNAKQALVLER